MLMGRVLQKFRLILVMREGEKRRGKRGEREEKGKEKGKEKTTNNKSNLALNPRAELQWPNPERHHHPPGSNPYQCNIEASQSGDEFVGVDFLH